MSLRSGNLEIIFILLTEVIAFYIQMTIVKIEFPRLEKSIEIIFSFDKCCRDLVSDSVNENPHKLLEKVIVWWSCRSRFKT